METPKPYKTSDLGIAAYLVYNNMNLLGCVQSGEIGRLFFVFEDSPDRDRFLEEWTSDKRGFARFFKCERLCKKRLQDPVE